MKVILLNPPGKKLYIRSYYCGSTSKANYLFQPLDLLMLSGFLHGQHDLRVIDCIAEKLDEKAAREKIEAEKAEAVVCVVSIVSWQEDLAFLYALKKRLPSVILVVNGDVFFEDPAGALQDHAIFDAIVFDFISDDICHYLAGREEKIANMIYRGASGIVDRRSGSKAAKRVFSMPIPRHEMFMSRQYRFPFARHYPFTTVLTNFGCPFTCKFCIAHRLGFRYRLADEVLDELRYISGLGIRELFFEDMTFGIPKENTLHLLHGMIDGDLRFGWTCYSRVDLVENNLLSLMKRAGCHTIMFGVESADESILQTYDKGYTVAQVREAFQLCRRLGIRTVATFILGLPEETRESYLSTIQLAKDIDCDYASFNAAAPRPGTELREIMISEGFIARKDMDFDHSGSGGSIASRYLTAAELSRLRQQAEREFYLRPSYLIRKLSAMRTPTEFLFHLQSVVGFFSQYCRRSHNKNG